MNLSLSFMQVSSAVHPKILDAGACGGTVLTDARPELPELFPGEEARPFEFSSIDELSDRVSDLLRQDLTEHRHFVRQHIHAEHTLLHRARQLASQFELR